MQILAEVKQHIEAEEFEEAIRLLLPQAEKGDADAQFLLGYLYFTSAEVEPEWAKNWLEKAAEQNHAEACSYLSSWGDNHCYGGWPKDEESWELLFRAANLGSSEAQYALGVAYVTRDSGLPLDAAKTREWYMRAAEQDNADALCNLGLMWLDGEGGAIDTLRGISLLKQVTLLGERSAQSKFAASILTEIYEKGLNEVLPDVQAAEQWRVRWQELKLCSFRSHPDWFYEKEDAR